MIAINGRVKLPPPPSLPLKGELIIRKELIVGGDAAGTRDTSFHLPLLNHRIDEGVPGRPGFSRAESGSVPIGHENGTGQGKMDITISAEHIIHADLSQIIMILCFEQAGAKQYG